MIKIKLLTKKDKLPTRDETIFGKIYSTFLVQFERHRVVLPQSTTRGCSRHSGVTPSTSDVGNEDESPLAAGDPVSVQLRGLGYRNLQAVSPPG